jgi:hypothetical protein
MNKKILFLLLLIFLPNFVLAFCPVCTVAVGAGVGLCRYLGIDDLISGSWIGGFLMSLSLWTIEFLNKKKIKFLFRKPLVLFFWYAITIFPLYFLGIMGHPENKFLGIDKLLFGIISGSIVFLISFFFNNFLLKRNQGKVYFKFQKVVIPILFLILLSLIFWRIR